jgi:hypothetical protein
MSKLHPAQDSSTVCPFCHVTHDKASAMGTRAVPGAGDATLCIRCGEWAIFDPLWKGGLRKPRFDEYQMLIVSKDATMLRVAWLQMRAEEAKEAKS